MSLLRRRVALVAVLGLLVTMVAASRDFGATWDERALQKYGEQLWDFYTGRLPRAEIDLSFGHMRIYGGLVDFLSVAVQRVVPADPYVVRHGVNAVFGWIGVVFAFLAASRLFGARAGWLAAILLVCMPRYIGESMNNPKDLPFAVLMLAGFHYILTLSPRYPYLSRGHALKLALAIALALNVRSMGFVLLGYTAIGLLAAIVASREWSRARWAATAGRFAVVALLALVGGTVFWPWAQEQPLVRPMQAFFLASTFSWGNPSLFAGMDTASSDLPWYYLPAWLGMTLPGVVIVGALLSIPRLWARPEARVQLAAMWAFVLVPATTAIVRHLSLYDGIRHMFFIVPPFALLAAAGWEFALARSGAAFRTAEKLNVLRLAVFVPLVVGIAEPLAFQVRNHPNQNVYFSPLMGGPSAAFGRFEMDYWGNCVLQATEWSARQAERARMPVGVAANAWEVLVADLPRFPSLWFRQRHHGGYHLDIRLLKGPREAVLETAADPQVLHRVTTADGTPLCVVLPGPEYPRLLERLAKAPQVEASR